MALVTNIEEAQQGTCYPQSNGERIGGDVSEIKGVSKCINEGVPVYVSYANEDNGKVDGNSYIVERINKDIDKSIFVTNLCQYFEDNFIGYKIDKHDLPVGEDITPFEEEIGKAKIVVVVLSDKYLRSKHCMYEWKEIHKNKYKKKIIYVLYDNERIYLPSENPSGIVLCDKGFNLIEKKYKALLYDEWCEYVRQCVNGYKKANNKLPKIDQYAFDNNFYLDELDNVMSCIKNNVSVKVSDNNSYKLVVDRIKQIIEIYRYGSTDKEWESYIINSICDRSVLVVGDNILKYSVTNKKIREIFGTYTELVKVEENGRLGDYYNKRLLLKAIQNTGDFNISNIRTWYDNYYNDREKIEQIEKDSFSDIQKFDNEVVIDNSDLKNLLNSGLYDVVISVGYSQGVIQTIKEVYQLDQINCYELAGDKIKLNDNLFDDESRYDALIDSYFNSNSDRKIHNAKIEASKNYNNYKNTTKNNSEHLPKKDWLDFFKDVFEEENNNEGLVEHLLSPNVLPNATNFDVIEYLRKCKNKATLINYIELVRMYRKNLIFSEAAIVNFINLCIIALSDISTNLLKDRFVLILGTHLPNWALRFMWENLSSNKNNKLDQRAKSLVENTFVDTKTERLISTNGGYIFNDESIDAFMHSFDEIKKKFLKEWKEGCNNVFVSYRKGNEQGFLNFINNYLTKIEEKNSKINFVWKKNITNEDIDDLKSRYDLQVIFWDSYSDDESGPKDAISIDVRDPLGITRIVITEGEKPNVNFSDVAATINLSMVSVDELQNRILQNIKLK